MTLPLFLLSFDSPLIVNSFLMVIIAWCSIYTYVDISDDEEEEEEEDGDAEMEEEEQGEGDGAADKVLDQSAEAHIKIILLNM